MTTVSVIGAAMTPVGKFTDRSLRDLTEEVVRGALTDAGVGVEAIDAVFFSNSVAGIVTGQESIRGQTALRGTGLLGKPIFNVENACASGSSAFFLARNAIQSGLWGNVLVVGAEKMAHTDRTVTYRALESASDLSDRAGDADYSSSIFMEIYAEKIKKYMAETGATSEDFAWIVVKNHEHAALNELAQFRNRLTVEDVLAAPEIAWPLTRPMCSPIGDGAAALVLSAGTSDRSVVVAGSAFSSGDIENDNQMHGHAVRRAATVAFEEAGVGAGDVDLAEVHDAAAPAEMEMYEALSFCADGDGPRLVRERATTLGGPLPVNTSGGLISRGHPVGMTGVAQLVEVVTQLRHEAGARQVAGARIGLVQNAGGDIGGVGAASAVHVLRRP
jgi:acetyl-CoA acetyltransferase